MSTATATSQLYQRVLAAGLNTAQPTLGARMQTYIRNHAQVRLDDLDFLELARGQRDGWILLVGDDPMRPSEAEKVRLCYSGGLVFGVYTYYAAGISPNQAWQRFYPVWMDPRESPKDPIQWLHNHGLPLSTAVAIETNERKVVQTGESGIKIVTTTSYDLRFELNGHIVRMLPPLACNDSHKDQYDLVADIAISCGLIMENEGLPQPGELLAARERAAKLAA